MKKLLLFGLGAICMNLSAVQAQDDNMVLNSSFEETDGKLKRPGEVHIASGWSAGTLGKADLFKKGVKNEAIQVPDNAYGRQKTDEGVSYAGITAYSFQNKAPRSYITSQLAGPMKAGAQYCVKVDVVLSDLSKYAVNNMGVHFSKKQVSVDSENHLLLSNPVLHTKNPIIKDMDIWETMCNVYEAKGGEKFITIGNFFENDQTKYEKMKRPKGFTSQQKYVAYYYIDNVRVTMVDGADECECGKKNGVTPSIIYSSKVISETEFTAEENIENAKVYFDFVKTDIQPAGKQNLDVLAKVLANNPTFKLQVKANIDKREREKSEKTGFYKDLAQVRADKVVKYLAGKGVSADRLEVVLVEDKEPVDTSGSEIAKAKNRRVEFVLK